MAGRTSNITTSSFKPLDLEEIMAVPLAKQQQEDQASLAIDDLSSLESNALEADREYVSNQIKALQDEASLYADQLMNQGVDSNLINKIKNLRKRKNKEFSLEGGVGKASAAYNEFKENEKFIMSRKDLSDQQKALGLAMARKNYADSGGAANQAQYENYIGASQVDLEKRGREIASLMTPQEIAGMLEMDYDEETGMYTDGTYSTKTLSANDISRVVYQALKNDQGVKDYLAEVDRLGIGDSESMLRNSSRNAGNIFQRKDYSENRKILNPSWSNRSVSGNRIVDPNNNSWDSQFVRSNESPFYDQIKIDDDFMDKLTFIDDNLSLGDMTKEDLVKVEELKKEISDYEKRAREAGASELGILNEINRIKNNRNKYSEKVAANYSNNSSQNLEAIESLKNFKENPKFKSSILCILKCTAILSSRQLSHEGGS